MVIDSITLDSVDGFDITAQTVADETYYAEPDGDYTDEQIAAFQRGDWGYVGIVVTASRAGIELGSGGIWGVEAGVYPLDSEVSEVIDPLNDAGGSLAHYRDDLVSEAVSEARETLRRLTDEAINTYAV